MGAEFYRRQNFPVFRSLGSRIIRRKKTPRQKKKRQERKQVLR
jgi:hypothetical protein